MDKIANTFTFFGNADVTIDGDFGRLRWVNTYRGRVSRTTSLSATDDEASFIDLQIPLWGALPVTAVVRQSWMLARDARTPLSSGEHVNGAVGLRYEPSDGNWVEGLGGAEHTSQLGVRATGALAGITAGVTSLLVDEWQLTARSLADWNAMDERRTNTDVMVSADVLRNLDEGSTLSLSVGYSGQRRDFLSTIVSDKPDELLVESRGERRLTVATNLLYYVTSALSISASGNVNVNGIDRSYQSFLQTVPITGVNRNLFEFLLDMAGEAVYTTSGYTVSGRVALFRRDEENGVKPVFAVDESAIASLRQQEVQRDNATQRTNLLGRIELRPSDVDTLRGECSGWLLRYDTPSTLNYDDRDELAVIASMSYARRLSPTVSVGVTLSGQSMHLVFLRAQRSAQNNINRVIRLTPTVNITGAVVTMQPQCEVLANYTVYDFEETAGSTRSYSFRQMSYRDSMRIQLTPALKIETQLLLRYSERSSLSWTDFAEVPQVSNTEYLAKMLIFSSNSGWSIGAGARAYQFKQNTLVLSVDQGRSLGSLRFWAPETAIRYTTTGGSTLSVSGWYEFQVVNEGTRRELPNLLLLAHIQF
ncbi:MAG: hypothetical protein SGJ05_01660 [bacterium]|nr:hypothetical protein [bacterium]